MRSNEELVKTKKVELVQVAVEALGDDLSEARIHESDLKAALGQLLDHGLTINPPEYSTLLHHITASSFGPNQMNPDLRGGESVKPGNVKMDMQRLLVAGAQSVIGIAGTLMQPWLLPMTALILWDRLWSLLRVKITDKEACVIWVMWMNCDEEQTVAEAILLPKVNEDRGRHGRAPLSEGELSGALATLERMDCIQRSRNDQSRWWLREWVCVKYR